MINKRLNELDNLKVVIVKELTDLETNLNNLKYKQNNLHESMEDINDKLDKLLNDMDKLGIMEQDPSILRINLFRNLGIKLENMPLMPIVVVVVVIVRVIVIIIILKKIV